MNTPTFKKCAAPHPISRRELLATLSKAGLAACFGGLISCGSVKPGGYYYVIEEPCTGCGECVPLCRKNAFEMNGDLANVRYGIEMSTCTACNECRPLCPDNAIIFDHTPYTIINCVGCARCLNVCPENAIVWNSTSYEASIITEKCNACRKCLAYCPYDLIVNGSFDAWIDQDKCTKCGECITDVFCRYNAIETIGITQPIKAFVNYDKCTRCGECITEIFCPEDAIGYVG